MNRADYQRLLAEIQKEMEMPGGNFQALFGRPDAKAMEQAKAIAAIALIAADRFYSEITRADFEMREHDEHA